MFQFILVSVLALALSGCSTIRQNEEPVGELPLIITCILALCEVAIGDDNKQDEDATAEASHKGQ